MSNSVSSRVNEVRSFVSESGRELLSWVNGSNGVVSENSGNMEGKVELMEGIEDNMNGNYRGIRDVLNKEIGGGKGEDIGLEGKIDENSCEVNREREERKGGDKVVEDKMDGEEGGGIGGDRGLGKGMDKEIEERRDGDSGLDNKLSKIRDEDEERLEGEEGSWDGLGERMVRDVSSVRGRDSEVCLKVKS